MFIRNAFMGDASERRSVEGRVPLYSYTACNETKVADSSVYREYTIKYDKSHPREHYVTSIDVIFALPRSWDLTMSVSEADELVWP